MSCIVAYDREGNIRQTFDAVVQRDEDTGDIIGLWDFADYEARGGKIRDLVDFQWLDRPVPLGIAQQVLGRKPRPGERIALPKDHPFRVAHDQIAGAAVWPEWLGGAANVEYDEEGNVVRGFKVDLDPQKRLKALVHLVSGHRRERADIEAAIAERINEKRAAARARGTEFRAAALAAGVDLTIVAQWPDPEPEPADIRDLVGGPDKPVPLDENGRTRPRRQQPRRQTE